MEGPKGKHVFGLVKVGERGQIVIPKQAREIFGIRAGDELMLIGDEESGLALVVDIDREMYYEKAMNYYICFDTGAVETDSAVSLPLEIKL